MTPAAAEAATTSPAPAASGAARLVRLPGADNDASQLLQRISAGLLRPSVPLVSAAAALARAGAGAGAGVPPPPPPPPPCARSLPLELLYDRAGLELFEAITQLPEYYLTAAEAEILRDHGWSIVATAGLRDGALLVELGAGSMRKTRLLLDAVVAAGLRGVRFFALDLCEASLEDALEGLQADFAGQGHLTLVGLVGTYQQGLSFVSSGGQGAQGGSSKHEGCGSVRGGSGGGSADGCGEGSGSMHSIGCGAVGDAGAGTEPVGSDGELDPLPPKLILWLGSSIGNLTREEAARFLRQLGDEAMQPGDQLLLGVDRRNAPSVVSAAYNDSQGATAAFTLNSLEHARRILAGAIAGGGHHVGEVLQPGHFKYVPVYNEPLGRHEAYVQATEATHIVLPASAAMAAAGLARESRGSGSGCAARSSAALGPLLAGAGISGNVNSCGGGIAVIVQLEEGELVHVEYSHKYSSVAH